MFRPTRKSGHTKLEYTYQKGHYFLSDRWIAHKFLLEFLDVVFPIVVIASLRGLSNQKSL